MTRNQVTYRASPLEDLACEETGLYDVILNAYQRLKTTGEDPAVVGSKILLLLAGILKMKDNRVTHVVKDGILIVLALFFPRGIEAGLPGRDIVNLTPREREWLRGEISAVLQNKA